MDEKSPGLLVDQKAWLVRQNKNLDADGDLMVRGRKVEASSVQRVDKLERNWENAKAGPDSRKSKGANE